MKMGDNNVIESKGKLCPESSVLAVITSFLFLCPGKPPKDKQGGMLGLDQSHCQVNANLVMWLSDNVANCIKWKGQPCTVALGWIRAPWKALR